MKKFVFSILLFILIFLLSNSRCNAQTTKTNQTLTVTDNTIEFVFENQNNSNLYNLSYKIYLPNNKIIDSKLTKIVPSNSSDGQSFIFDQNQLEDGTYIIYVKGSYYNSNNAYNNRTPKPFLSYHVLQKNVTDVLNLNVEESNLNINQDTGSLHLSIKSNDTAPQTIKIDLILPDGIITNEENLDGQVQIESNEIKKININFTNQWRNQGDSSNIVLIISRENTKAKIVQSIPFTITKRTTTVYTQVLLFILITLIFLVSSVYLKFPKKIVNLIFLLIITLFIFQFIPLKFLLLNTSTTGGDTFSHYGIARFLVENIFPKLNVTGWYPGSYAGFPVLTFYMPLPFLLIYLFSLIIKFNFAFKLITLLGIILLPTSTYLMTKDLKFPRWGRLLAAAFSLIFVFNESYTMYGGNVLSTFAGEFSHSIGLSILIFFTGRLYRGIIENKYLKLNAILLFLIGFTHPYPFVIAVLIQLFFIIPKFFKKEKLKQNLIYLIKMDLLAFLLIVFWAVPMVLKIKYATEAMTEFWPLKIKEILPKQYYPFIAVAIITLFYTIFKKKKNILYLFFPLYISTIFLFTADKVNLINIRFIPTITFYMLCIAAFGIGVLLKFINKKIIIISEVMFLILIGLAFFTVYSNTNVVTSWAKWNYTGYENKPYSYMYNDLMNYIASLPGNERVVYEHSPIQENFGTSRTFESLYEFTGKPTHEGVYIQSSSTSPFVYYMQSEVSEVGTGVIVGNTYTTFNADFDKMLHHLDAFNVRYYIASSDKVKNQLSQSDKFKLLKEFPPYAIYEYLENSNSYVKVLPQNPNFVDSPNFNKEAYQWFINDDLNYYLNVNKKDMKYIPEVIENCDNPVEVKEFSNEKVKFHTENLNCPHLIKISYFPNWHPKGAKKIFQVNPNFMLVYPEQKDVELNYSNSTVEYVSMGLTLAGLLLLIFSSKINLKKPFVKIIAKKEKL